MKAAKIASSKRIVWITGASSGIGKALALEYATQNTSLILSSRRQPELEKVKSLCMEQGLSDLDVLVLPLDVTEHQDFKIKVRQAFEFKGRLDVLINNAGVSQRSSCLNTDMQTYRTLFEVDVFGQIALTKAVLPLMIEQSAGHIAVTASVAGKIGVPLRTGYCAVKHAMMGFFDSLRSEVAHQNIQISTITPGYIQTDVSKNALSGDGSKYGRMEDSIAKGMPVNQCAKVIVAGLNKGKKEIAVGRGIEMQSLWLKRFFPSILIKLLEREYHQRAAKDNL